MNTTPLPAIDSSAAWTAALRWGLQQAMAQQARRIVCVDPGFESWPLDDAEMLQGMTRWLRLPQRQWLLLAANYDEVPRRQPRFTAWRRDWVHAMQTWQAPPELAADLPSVLLDDRGLSVVLLDAAKGRGRASLELRTARLWQERVDAVLQRSHAAFAVNTLGL